MYNYIFPTTYGWLGLCQMDRGLHTARVGGWRCAAELMVCSIRHSIIQSFMIRCHFPWLKLMFIWPIREEQSDSGDEFNSVVTLGILGGLAHGCRFVLVAVRIVFGVMEWRKQGKDNKRWRKSESLFWIIFCEGMGMCCDHGGCDEQCLEVSTVN